MAIAANKVPGVYGATCHDSFSTERVRKGNNAQVMTMGAQVLVPNRQSLWSTSGWNQNFRGGRSQPKGDKIKKIEEKYMKKIKETSQNPV